MYLDLLFVFGGFFVLKLFNEQVLSYFANIQAFLIKLIYIFSSYYKVLKILEFLDFRYV